MSGRSNIEIADVNARRAIDAPADAPLLALVGRAASGKTETLARRYVALLARDSTLNIGATIVTAADSTGAGALAARIDTLLAGAHGEAAGRRYFGCGLERFAFDLLADHATLSGLSYDLEAIDSYDAQEIFARAIAPLFSADWNEYLGPDIDPEIPGLRAPDRFAAAVLRLIHKLRDAHMSPEAFLDAARRGATAFYANPPNLAAPSLLSATKDEHRSALTVGTAELERQRRRELDLAKIIAKVYRSYLDGLVAHGCLTASDAVAEATRLLEEQPALARSYRQRLRIAIVDDAHDLTTGNFRLLSALFGKTLRGVTIAGDPNAATRTFAGARPERVFGAAAATLELQANYRVPLQIAALVRTLLDGQTRPEACAGNAVEIVRLSTPAEETAFVADSVAALLSDGTPAQRIAVVHRSLRTLAAFEDALVDRDIPVALHGDGALFARHDTLDALALLWSTVDPFAHAWLLRVLQMPLLGVSDASLGTLCGEPANPQAALFDFPAQDETDGSRRWDRRRDVRLGTNVVRGDRDTELDSETRARLSAFRERRASWQSVARTAGVVEAAAAIVTDGGMYAGRPPETAARARRRGRIVDALLDTLERYTRRNRNDDLRSALRYCERIARSENGPLLAGEMHDGVVVASIDCIKARRFDHVFVVDVRAGSFPPYYVPDAFLFSPTYGMIPKDSVGEAVTARTAKFIWYSHHTKLRESYAREDRRALCVALSRADIDVTICASGRPTRAIAAPELLAELEALRPPLATARRRVVAVAAAALSNAAVSSASASVSSVRTPIDETAPAQTLIDVVSAERIIESALCAVCAPHRAIAATLDTAFTLLSGRLPATDHRVAERDTTFAFPLGSKIVVGTAPALIREAGRLYVAVTRTEPIAAALPIYGLQHRVVGDGYFVETVDGSFEGPHAISIAELIELAARVARGELTLLCQRHQSH